VLEYLGRYTHRVAISNERIVSLNRGIVRFRWKDYADGGRVISESAAPVKRLGYWFVSFRRSRRSHLYALVLA
jgi:hypothetical protein